MACVPGLAISYLLLRMPLQVGDSLTLVLDAAESPSVWASFYSHLSNVGYFRPLFYAQVKAVFDLAQGDYHLAYRLYHAAWLMAFVLLFVRALDVRSRAALVLVPLALTVFFGVHTFLATVKEIYPISHFLQIAVLSLAALNLAQSKGGRLVELATLATFAAAALILESGLLVWVVIAAAWLARAPGISTRAVAAATVLLGAYFVARFGYFGTGAPSLDERSAGYLLGALDPAELQARFGDNPAPFYAYNVFSSISSVLFSQPRSGVFVLVRQFRGQGVLASSWINLAASLFATGLIAAYVVHRLRSGIRWPRTVADRHVFIFGAVLAANGVIGYAYAKDEIVSVAGAFYAVAVFSSALWLVQRLRTQPPSWRTTALVAVLLCTGAAVWAIRAAGVPHALHSQAFVQRNDWVRVERSMRENGDWERYQQSIPLVRSLRDQAISTPVVNPRFIPRWKDRVFDTSY
jgi:hypothetical protein